MITDLLSTNEKKTLIQLMKRVIKSDGKISKQEKIYFDAYSKQLKISKSNIKVSASIKDLCKNFKSYNSKVVCLLEIIGIAWIDNSFAKEEKNIINEVFDNFGISKSNFKSYSNWARDAAKLDLRLFKFLKY
jgi:uncharacterized tellurite resistance protein B-like protein